MKQRVFLVEDQRRMRELLIDLFSSSGDFQVVGTACTEGEALLWLEEHGESWDLAVIDLVLDDGSGSSVVRRARDMNYGGLVAVLSSCVTDSLREHVFSLGADTLFDEKDTTRFVAWLGKIGKPYDAPMAGGRKEMAPAAARSHAA
ncbi:MAG TPA: response regulator [Ramlibacter sp.]|nr:response regulator [Ramlibacter sp.]